MHNAVDAANFVMMRRDSPANHPSNIREYPTG
jgi:hypothetical protein